MNRKTKRDIQIEQSDRKGVLLSKYSDSLPQAERDAIRLEMMECEIGPYSRWWRWGMIGVLRRAREAIEKKDAVEEMIVIKTRMKKIPSCCQQCKFYCSSRMYGEGCCAATGELKNLSDITISRRRAEFCPLEKIELKGGKIG